MGNVMAKIVLIGAGSHVFSRRLITDILTYEELRDSTITLMDIDTERLSLIKSFAEKLVGQYGFETRIESTTDRREALQGADYVCLLYTSPSPRDLSTSRMPSSA